MHFAGACFQRRSSMFFRRACSTTYTITTGTASEHQHYITRGWRFTANIFRFYCAYNGSHFKSFCHIFRVINLAKMCCCQAYLISIAGISGGCFCRDYSLWQFTDKCFIYRLIDISRTCYAHCLINISTT